MLSFKSASSLHLIGPIGVESLHLPMVGTRICAGFPSPADDFLDEEIDLVKVLTPNPVASFMWRVQGSSMVDAGIFDGDVVVVDRSAVPKHGDVVVCSINGETSLKLYEFVGGPRLVFANRDMPAFALDDLADIEVWGVATWTLHKPRLR